jgi:hypothetical protein
MGLAGGHPPGSPGQSLQKLVPQVAQLQGASLNSPVDASPGGLHSAYILSGWLDSPVVPKNALDGHYPKPNSSRRRDATSTCNRGESVPRLRRIIPARTVISRCNWTVDETRKPVVAKSSSVSGIKTSERNGLDRTRLVIKARTTWR